MLCEECGINESVTEDSEVCDLCGPCLMMLVREAEAISDAEADAMLALVESTF